MIITALQEVWKLSFNKTTKCIQHRFHKWYRNISGCPDFINNEKFNVEYIQKNKTSVLWYPTIECNEDCERMRKLSSKCKNNLENNSRDMKYSLMPTLLWSYQIKSYAKIFTRSLIQLHLFDKSIFKHCRKTINQHTIDTSLHNITIVNLNGSHAHNACKSYLSNSNTTKSECHKNGKFCFQTCKLNFLRKAVVFITKDMPELKSTDKHIYILRHFAVNKKIHDWCKESLQYKLSSRIIQKTFQNYYLCYGSSDLQDKDVEDSWFLEEITEKDTLVAINEVVSRLNGTSDNIDNTYLNVESSNLLQALIFTNNSISPSLYKSLIDVSHIPSKHSSLFNITIFHTNQIKANMIKSIQAIGCAYEENSHFIKQNDMRSVWSPLNWIFFHNCSFDSSRNDTDKEMLLFLTSVSTSDIEQVCKENTSVLLTSIRRENVPFLSKKVSKDLKRECTDAGVGNVNDKACTDLIRDGSDYETRFFHFLVHPKNWNTDFAIKQLFKQLDDEKLEMNINETKYEFNSHPEITHGITFLNENILNEALTSDDNEETLRKTLQIFVLANMTNNTQCLNDLRKKRFSINVYNKEDQPRYVLGPIGTEITNEACLSTLHIDIYEDLKASNESYSITVNKVWPTCLHNMLIVWPNNSKIIQEWDYLSTNCKISEGALLSLCIAITAITIVGNLFVLTVIICSDLMKKKSFMIYTSLAVADLLMGITTAALAVYDTFQFMTGSRTIHDLHKHGVFTAFDALVKQQVGLFNQLRFERDDWGMVSSIAMTISVISSLLSLALLGIDRLMMLSGRQLEKQQVKRALSLAWALSVFCSMMVNYRQNGFKFVGFFDPITKLTINIAYEKENISRAFFYTAIIIGGTAGLTIVIATIVSTVLYNMGENRKQNAGTITIHDPHREDKRHEVTTTFLMMVTLFLISSGSLCLDLLINPVNNYPLVHFMLWWTFMAAGSWNWLLYCFRGQTFRKEAKKVMRIYSHSEESQRERQRRIKRS